MTGYNALARFYDRLMHDFDYVGMTEFILDRIISKQNGISLADGTGKISVALSLRGKKMTALDYSPEMLTEAAKYAKSQGQRVTFIEGDINVLELPERYDFAVAVCDALNYLKPTEVNAFFKTVYTALHDNGVFIFDISSEYKLTKILADEVYFEDDEDLTSIMSNSYDKKSGYVDMAVTIFERQGETFKRYDDDSRQYVHKTAKLIKAAEAVGFSAEVFDGESYGEVSDSSARVLFVLRKSRG